MTSICFYISDYGYVYIKTNGPFNFVRQSLPQKNVEVMQSKTGKVINAMKGVVL